MMRLPGAAMSLELSPEDNLAKFGVRDVTAKLLGRRSASERATSASWNTTYSVKYPLEALGDVLGPAAKAIAAKVQCPAAMAAQSVLAAASLAAQAIADVRLPFGQIRPLSLYFLTVAQSGDRKSTSDNEAMVPIRMREAQLRDAFAPIQQRYEIERTAWKAQRAQIEKKRNSIEARRIELEQLGSEPHAPLRPLLTVAESTAEGLAKMWPLLCGALGIFSAEGGQFLGGHGFSDEAKLRTAAALSGIWDGDGLRRLRAGDGITDLRGRRLTTHLMVQPEAASGVLRDPVLRDQGLLSRFLLAAPKSLAGTRFWCDQSNEIEQTLSRFHARILTVFEQPINASNSAGNELTPRVIGMSTTAREAWITFYNRIEAEMQAGASLDGLKDVAGKMAEQAARIAGILAVVDCPETDKIDEDVMRRACAIAEWHLSEAARLALVIEESATEKDARLLREWIEASRPKIINATIVSQRGPNSIRAPARRDAAIHILCESGFLIEAGRRGTWRVAIK